MARQRFKLSRNMGMAGAFKMSQSRGGRRDSTDIGLPIQQNIDGLCYVL